MYVCVYYTNRTVQSHLSYSTLTHVTARSRSQCESRDERRLLMLPFDGVDLSAPLSFA